MFKLDAELLLDILRNFYNLTGAKTVVWDCDYNEICSYPEKLEYVLDKKNFELAQNSDNPYVFTCEKGLCNVIFPLYYDDRVIAYIMFGQIRDEEEKYANRKNLKKIGGSDENAERYFREAPILTYSQILSAARFLSISVLYLQTLPNIKVEKNNIASQIHKYILGNIATLKKVDEICLEFGISLSYLYAMSHQYFGMPIGNYIASQRINVAKQYLLTTQKSISEISELCGFCDYNYFSRRFKKQTGCTPLAYRKNAMNDELFDINV